MSAVGKLEDQIGHKLDVVHFYQGWGGRHAAVNRDWISRAASKGRSVLLTWEPWVSGGPAAQPDYALSNILAGRYDEYIESWARGLKACATKIYLRPMHEMNGNWYPWSGAIEENSPRKYRRAWRHVRHIFDRIHASNIAWVWCPLVDDVPAHNHFEHYYPGDDYVDVIGLDGYNWGTSEPGYGGWRSFEEIFGPAYNRLMKLSDKPVWIAEVASATEGGDKASWVNNMFRALTNGFLPRLRALVWFHILKERDWRATSPHEVAKVFSSWLPRLS